MYYKCKPISTEVANEQLRNTKGIKITFPLSPFYALVLMHQTKNPKSDYFALKLILNINNFVK